MTDRSPRHPPGAAAWKCAAFYRDPTEASAALARLSTSNNPQLCPSEKGRGKLMQNISDSPEFTDNSESFCEIATTPSGPRNDKI